MGRYDVWYVSFWAVGAFTDSAEINSPFLSDGEDGERFANYSERCRRNIKGELFCLSLIFRKPGRREFHIPRI